MEGTEWLMLFVFLKHVEKTIDRGCYYLFIYFCRSSTSLSQSFGLGKAACFTGKSLGTDT